ncbi:MAG: tyrosine-type recombinase/integrase [Phycisphaerae bacterium]
MVENGRMYTKLYTTKWTRQAETTFTRCLMASLIQRGEIFYIQHCVSGKARRTSTGTNILQLAKEKLRQFESSLLYGSDSPLPTRTPIDQVIGAYIRHIRIYKTAKSAQTDTYYLREAFGPICPELEITSRKPSQLARKRPIVPGQDRRRKPIVIEASSFEQITTAQIAAFISGQFQGRGLAPKTANRYREILVRLFNWTMQQGGVHLPGDNNPAARVQRYKEHAPEIRFLTLQDIDTQLIALRLKPQLQTMVAMYIYAGLRREELLWLTIDDVDLANGPHGLIRIRAKTIGEQFWQPKTKVNRAVPISSTLRQYLDQYAPRKSTDRWYFPSPTGQRWDPDNFSQDLRAANQEAGLPWGSLDYRHTFGSQLAMKGESLYKIATLMGNSPEICRRHYAALIPECLTASVEFSPYLR